MFPSSRHECVGGEVHRGWRCSGAHRGQTGGYGHTQSLYFCLDIHCYEQVSHSPVSLSVCIYMSGVQSSSGTVQKMVTFKSPVGRRAREQSEPDGDENLGEQNYVQALGTEGKWSLLNTHYTPCCQISFQALSVIVRVYFI